MTTDNRHPLPKSDPTPASAAELRTAIGVAVVLAGVGILMLVKGEVFGGGAIIAGSVGYLVWKVWY